MNGVARFAALHPVQTAALWIALACGLPMAANAQSASPANAGTTSASQVSSRPVISLDGNWRFQIGDDLRWAEPGFDDSMWPLVSLSQPLVEQGLLPYSGYAWYRMRLQPQQLAALGLAGGTHHALVSGIGVAQFTVYVNNVEVGHTRGMIEPPKEFQSTPVDGEFSWPDASAPVVLAIRTWAGPDVTVNRGLLTRVELGPGDEITLRLSAARAHQWNENAVATLLAMFLFLNVAALGLALFLAQRHHAEYLWLALMCLSVAVGEASGTAFGLEWISLGAANLFDAWNSSIFIAVALEFVFRFTSTPANRILRGFQIVVLALPLIHLAGQHQIFETLSVAAEIGFCGVVSVVLYCAWRGGRGEAGVMLPPFLLAAVADSANIVLVYAAQQHWIPQQFAAQRFYLGPVAFGAGVIAMLVFLGSLVAVILYRFIRASLDEQRSNAEIAAARSVQALLIPTQLPSNRNFMLESAYLPVNGVGGDFFQVLPLKDDSLLIVVGDVSGKGLQAAMNSSTLVGALRNELSHDPATVLAHLNHVLIGAVASPGAVPELDASPCYATCLCARIYPDGTLVIANAGHLSPYRDGRELPLLPGLPLGVIADVEYEQSTFELNHGDRLVFISDGVVEAINSDGELFGFERTQQVSNEPARYIAQTARRFGQTDDITVVSLYVASRTARTAGEEAVSSK